MQSLEHYLLSALLSSALKFQACLHFLAELSLAEKLVLLAMLLVLCLHGLQTYSTQNMSSSIQAPCFFGKGCDAHPRIC